MLTNREQENASLLGISDRNSNDCTKEALAVFIGGNRHTPQWSPPSLHRSSSHSTASVRVGHSVKMSLLGIQLCISTVCGHVQTFTYMCPTPESESETVREIEALLDNDREGKRACSLQIQTSVCCA